MANAIIPLPKKRDNAFFTFLAKTLKAQFHINIIFLLNNLGGEI